MFCIFSGGSLNLLLERVGGLSLLERALLSVHSAGFKKIVYPMSFQKSVQEILNRNSKLKELQCLPDTKAPFSGARLEWNLDWVIWPLLLGEFLSRKDEGNLQLLDSDSRPAGLRWVVNEKDTHFLSHQSSNSLWPLQEVKSKADIPNLLKSFYKALRKPTDGFVSRHLNRPVSIAVSSQLVKVGVTPSVMTTFCILLTVFAALLALSPNPLWLAVAGVLFHLASTLDGCDGEIARLTFTGSTFGAWYDTLGDNARYGFFFACLGIRAFHSSGHAFYIWTLAGFVPLMIYFVYLNSRYLIASNSGGTFLAVASKIVSEGKKKKTIWDRFVTPLQPLTKLDVQAFAVMIFCILGFPEIMFWMSVIGLVFMTWSTIRMVSQEEKRLNQKISNHWAFFFLCMGSYILVYLFREVPVHEIFEALRRVGWGGALLVFLTAPLWYFFNTLTLWKLTEGKVPLKNLFFNHLVGESYNNILPLAGLAGEPFKVKHLSQFVDSSFALKVVVRDKLLNAQAGMVLTSLTGVLTLLFTPLPEQWKNYLLAGVAIMALASFVVLYVMLSAHPMKIVASLLQKFKMKQNFELQGLGAKLYWAAFSLKFLGRLSSMLEVALILYFLHLPFTGAYVFFFTFMISASGLIFFMVPQGIGVNEAGLAGAFQILGWSTPSGIALALVRRARILIWALIGILLHLLRGLTFFTQSKAVHVSGN